MNEFEYLKTLNTQEFAQWLLQVEEGDFLPDDLLCAKKCGYADNAGDCTAFSRDGEFAGCIYTALERIEMWLDSPHEE